MLDTIVSLGTLATSLLSTVGQRSLHILVILDTKIVVLIATLAMVWSARGLVKHSLIALHGRGRLVTEALILGILRISSCYVLSRFSARVNTLYDVFICIADFFELADVGFEILILAALIHNLTTILIR